MSRRSTPFEGALHPGASAGRKTRLRWLRVLAVIAAGILLSAMLFRRLEEDERRRIALDFERDASDRISAFRLAMVHGLDSLVALDAFFSAASDIERSVFASFTLEHLVDEPGVEYLAWAPRVRRSERADFEESVRRERVESAELQAALGRYRVFGKQTGSAAPPVSEEDDLFPIFFAEPGPEVIHTLGFDVASDPDQRQAQIRARETGLATAGPRTAVRPDTEDLFGFLVYSPVFRRTQTPTGSEETAQALRGYVVGFFNVREMMDRALEGLEPRGVDIAVHDVAALRAESLLHFHRSRLETGGGRPWTIDQALDPQGLGLARTIRLAEHDWLVSCQPAPGYIEARRGWTPRLVLASGLLLTGLAAGYLSLLLKREVESEERARDLLQAKLALERQAVEREKAQAELAHSEERFRRAFDGAPVGMGVVDLQGKFVQVNESLARMLGYEIEELLELSVADVTHPYDREREGELMKELLSGRTESFQVVERLRRRDGRVIWAELSISLVRDQSGRPLYFIGQQQDVSQRKATEDALREVRETQARILDGLPLNVFLKDSEGRIEFLNARARKLLGLGPAEDIRGKTDFDLFPREIARQLREGDRRALEEGGVQNIEEEIEIEGKKVHLLAGKQPLVVEGSQRPFLLGFSIDVTELKKAQEALRSSELRFRELVENMRSGVAVIEAVDWGADFVVRDYNRAAERMDRKRREEVIGSRLPDALAWALEMGLEEIVRRVWSTGRAEELPRVLFTGERGEEWRRANVYKLPSQEIVVIYDDVTESKRLETELLHAQKMEAVGRLAGGVAHDFNNLLQVISGNADLLLEAGARGRQAEELLAEIHRQAERGSQLARRLLVFSRRESEEAQLLDLAEVVSGGLKLVGRLLKENIKVSFETSGEPLPVVADRGQLEQVLMNLVVNAADAMPKGGALEIRCGSGSPEEVWVSVADTGTGIPAEVIDKIFDPYFTTKSAAQGTGLGLAVVDGIVSVHGGRITVDNRPEGGVEFTVYLPRSSSAPGESKSSSEARYATRGHGEQLLVVEDQELVRRTMESMLTSLGYSVTSVADGAAARRLVGEKAFDLLVTDVVLTDTTGVDLALEFKERHPDLGVLLVSGYAEEAQRQRGSGLRFLQKPFRLDDLAREVAAALAERASTRA